MVVVVVVVAVALALAVALAAVCVCAHARKKGGEGGALLYEPPKTKDARRVEARIGVGCATAAGDGPL